MDFMFDWEVEGDRFSFEDSDRFEEDSLCSWISEPESLCNNWRGWRKQNGGNSQSSWSGKNKGVTRLLELAAQAVASHIPFEVVEHFYPPVPEQLQLRIAFWSFPENEEDIRLYSCLANGSADEFQKGEHLYKAKAIKDPLQIGFHLSATVIPPQSLAQVKGNFSVAVVFDRRRITSCTCTCNPQASWCAHVVALCLFRILQHSSVCLRAPVSESLSRLHRDQLQKFAQYLISELPQQVIPSPGSYLNDEVFVILPTAQRLLDELLSSQQSEINQQGGAPDPTAGASAHEHTTWCLDEQALHDNIKKTLVKFCVPAPIVFSDVNYLTSTAPPAAAEWQNLLRPLRGREPEGMWNLLSIVREMFKRSDSNAIPLLEILTDEVMACDTVNLLVWWFQTKISASHNSVTCYSRNNNASNQHAAASLCDEIVTLWRLAALNPALSPIEREDLEAKLRDWHIKTVDKVRKARGNTAGSAANPMKKSDIELFSGFKSAIETCQLDWTDYPIPGVTFMETKPSHKPIITPRGKFNNSTNKGLGLLKKCSDKVNAWSEACDASNRYQKMKVTDGNLSSGSEGFCENERDLAQQDSDSSVADDSFSTVNKDVSFHATSSLDQQVHFEAELSVADDQSEATAGGGAAVESGQLSGDEYQMYFFDPRIKLEEKKKKTTDDADYFASLRKIDNRHEILFARAESLHAHGYIRHACILAQQLAEEMLANPPDLMSENLNYSGKGKKKKTQSNISSFTSTTLAKAAFLCMVLLEDAECHHLAFQMGMFGLEMPRQPACSKALEVKLANQECELVTLLKKIPLGLAELNVIRDRAKQLREGNLRTRGDALLPLMLASFIFDSLCLPAIPVNGNNARPASRQSLPASNRMPTDEQLGFDAAVAALGLKANVSEAEHALLCEGNRRQRGDLAIAMLVQYKDDQEKLDKILDKLLDKEIHSLYKVPSLTTYLKSPKQKIQPVECAQSSSDWSASRKPFTRHVAANLEYLNLEQQVKAVDLSGGAKPKVLSSEKYTSRDTDSSAMEEEGDSCDYKAWEAKFRCTSLRNPKKHSVGMASIDSSAPETTSSDNSPTLVRRNWSKIQGPGSDSGSSGKSSDSVGSSSSGDKGTRAKVRDGESPVGMQRFNQHVMVDTRGGLPGKTPRFKGKNRMPTVPNQPSEASAHFMFELAKTVLVKAGGSSTTSLFTQPNTTSSHGTSHRALHLCAFQIGLYALGLHNCVSANWLSRTYSSHVSWITGQAMEIGSAAINILIDTWEGHLTPPEVASLADRASRGRDPNMVRAAAELALSCLPHAHALNPNEIQRALNQCKEQSREMLERACLAVETAAKDGGVYPEVLFEVARRWYELYEEGQQSMEHHDGNSPNELEAGAHALVPVGPLAVMDQDSVHVFTQVMSQQPTALPPPPPMAVPISYAIPPLAQPAYTFSPYVQPIPNYNGQFSQPHLPIPTMSPNIHTYVTNYTYPNHQSFQAHPFNQAPIQNVYSSVPPPVRGPAQPPYHVQTLNNHGLNQQPDVNMQGAMSSNQSVNPPSVTQPGVVSNTQHMNYLHAAFRVCMLAMEMLGRRVHDDRPQTKYARNPPYGEDVKWSLKVAMKLGATFLQQFTASVVNAVVSPFILQDIALDSAHYLSRNNPSQVSALLRSNVLNPLIQKCLQMFHQCVHQRLHHIQQSEYDEFVSIVCSARNAFCITPGGMVQFNELLQSLRRAKSCKKDLWMRIVNGLATGQHS